MSEKLNFTSINLSQREFVGSMVDAMEHENEKYVSTNIHSMIYILYLKEQKGAPQKW